MIDHQSPDADEARFHIARIDSSHRSCDQGASSEAVAPVPPELVAAAGGRAPELAAQQLRAQARQLSQYLRDRLRDIDQREAELNARIAHFESELAVSRLWLRERLVEFENREQELRRQESELNARLEASDERRRARPTLRRA